MRIQQRHRQPGRDLPPGDPRTSARRPASASRTRDSTALGSAAPDHVKPAGAEVSATADHSASCEDTDVFQIASHRFWGRKIGRGNAQSLHRLKRRGCRHPLGRAMTRAPSSPPARRPSVTDNRRWPMLRTCEIVAAWQRVGRMAQDPSEMRADARLFLLICVGHRGGIFVRTGHSPAPSLGRTLFEGHWGPRRDGGERCA